MNGISKIHEPNIHVNLQLLIRQLKQKKLRNKIEAKLSPKDKITDFPEKQCLLMLSVSQSRISNLQFSQSFDQVSISCIEKGTKNIL